MFHLTELKKRKSLLDAEWHILKEKEQALIKELDKVTKQLDKTDHELDQVILADNMYQRLTGKPPTPRQQDIKLAEQFGISYQVFVGEKELDDTDDVIQDKIDTMKRAIKLRNEWEQSDVGYDVVDHFNIYWEE